MYEINVENKSARIDFINHNEWIEVDGKTPRDALMNLIFRIEQEFSKLDAVDSTDLNEGAQDRLQMYGRFMKGME